jgi:hypothetical protein
VGKKDDTLKSWILLVAGLAGIAYQQWTGEVNWLLLLIFTTMTGVPGLAQLFSLIKSSPIVLQSQSSPPEHLESGSENVSSKSLGEDK